MTFGLLQNVSDEYMNVFIQKLIALFLYMRPKVKGVPGCPLVVGYCFSFESQRWSLT